MQFILLLAVSVKFYAIDNRLSELMRVIRVEHPGSNLALPPQPVDSVGEQAAFDYRELRQILRDEIRAAYSDSPDDSEPEQAHISAIDETELRYRWDLAVEELEFLKGQDEVTTEELNNLVGMIARLDPERRTELMKRLNQALNRGEIQGTL